MTFKNILTGITQLHRRLNGSTAEYDLNFYENYLNAIKKHSNHYVRKSDGYIKNISRQLIDKALKSSSSDDLLVEAYIIVREAIQRILKISPFQISIKLM